MSTLRGEWRTPRWLRLLLYDEFGPFTLDAAASADNAVCPRFLEGPCHAPGKCFCGLCSSWAGERVFLNPPFDAAGRWARKCDEERNRALRIVAIFPTGEETRWWNDYVDRGAREIIRTLGRIQYDPPPGIEASTNRQTTSLVVWERDREWEIPSRSPRRRMLHVKAAMAAYVDDLR